MRLLVTGGAGFVGSHLVERLVRERTGSVVVFDNLHRGKRANLSPCEKHLSFVAGDIRDTVALQEVMAGCTHVFHLASQSNVMGSLQDPDFTLSSNVTGTYNVLEAAHRARVARVVFASSREVYGEPSSFPVAEDAPLLPKNLYGVTKAAGESLCRLFSSEGLEIAILRLANVYGSRDVGRVIPLFVEKSLKNETLTVFGGRQTLDLVWVHSVVEILMRSAFDRYVEEPVNVGSGRGVSITELVQRVLDVTQSKSSVEVVAARGIEVVGFVADVTRAQRYFNLVPPTDSLEHLGEVVEWFRTDLMQRVDGSTKQYPWR